MKVIGNDNVQGVVGCRTGESAAGSVFSAPRRRNLVFARVGRQSFHPHWLAGSGRDRNWDLQLSTWIPEIVDSTRVTDASGDFPIAFDPGVKYSSIARYFAENPQLLRQYDYIMLPDDDLLFEEGSITRLFDVCREHDLVLAQPALNLASYASYPIVLQCPSFRLRYSNYIEPMTPIFRSDYLAQILPHFERWPTGWGHDDVWSFLMADPNRASAVIDSEPVIHLRPLFTGELYETFRKRGMDPLRDVAEINSSFTNLRQGKKVYGGVSREGSRVGRAMTNLFNGLHLLRAAGGTRDPGGTRKTGLRMLSRIVTAIGYRPTAARFREEFIVNQPSELGEQEGRVCAS